MKRVALFLILGLSLSTVACSPLEQLARNTAAALQGALSAAQTQYLTECTANPKDQPCVIINQAVAGQNALVTAVEAYCGWSVTAPPANGTQTCVPVKSAAAGLQTSINNANLFITELKAIITPHQVAVISECTDRGGKWIGNIASCRFTTVCEVGKPCSPSALAKQLEGGTQ